jgi:hypothetical protein
MSEESAAPSVSSASRAGLRRFGRVIVDAVLPPRCLAEDHDGVPVFLARNAWDLRRTMEDWPKVRFSEAREQN